MIYYIGEDRLLPSEIIQTACMDDLLGWLEGKDCIAIDTETQGWMDFENKVISLQVGDGADQFVINTLVIDVQPLREVMQSKTVEKMFWNAKFDINFLRFDFGWITENVYDGFLAECVLTTGIDKAPLSLESAVLRYCDYQLNKEVRGKIMKSGLTDEVVVYAAEDVAFLHMIKEKQLQLLKQYELEAVLALENETVLAVADIEYNGMKIDPAKWLEIADITEANVIIQQELLDQMVIDDTRLARYVPKYVQGNLFGEEERIIRINWASSTQVLPILKAIGLKIETTGEKEIVKYRATVPLVRELISYKKQDKLANSFGRRFLKFINKRTDRIHQSIWQVLDTGRMSSSEPNLTQIPSKGELAKKMRACFIPKEGYLFVGGDFSGCELRIIAEGSKDPVWIAEFNGEGKVHDKVACMMFGIGMSQTKDTPEFLMGSSYRDVAKTIGFGLAYGMSASKLSATVRIPVKLAEELIDNFFKAFPAIKGFLTALGNYGKHNGFIRTYRPFRRIRFYPDWFQGMQYDGTQSKRLGEIERQSKNTPIQGANADITKSAMCTIRRYIIDNNCPVTMINVVHDEIITECKEGFAEEWRLIMNKLMTEAGALVVKSIPMTVDCKIMTKWEK